ncbi:hypothetical protein DFP73DRAFT_530148 [Morchella snyderi]|nr:hypothetical protein DFP73DRAFT_530148 [Morchella snyderi]
MEETANISYSEYDDSPENAHESSEKNLDAPKEEPQAPTQNASQRAPTASQRTPTASQRTPTASQRASTLAPSQEGSQRAFPAYQRAFPESQRALPIPSQSMPSSVPVYSRDIDYSSSTRHINLSSMCSRYSNSSPTYRPYRSSPSFEGVGESSMSSPRIFSSPQVYLPEAQPRVYDIAQLSSSIREEENAPIVESEVLVVSMWAAASRRVRCTVDLDEVVIKQVRSLHSRVRSHLMHEVKGRLADSTIYGPGNLSGPEARAAQAEYLLKNDRFLSPAQHHESTRCQRPDGTRNAQRAPENGQTALVNAANRYYTYRLRFLAPEIIDIFYYKYFDGVRMRGVKDREFLERITPTFNCLISTAIWHGIRAW